jgi:hypothetical protein
MLLTRTGTGSPKPDLTPAGILGVVVALGTAALALAHLWHLVLRGDRPPAQLPGERADQRPVRGGPG